MGRRHRGSINRVRKEGPEEWYTTIIARDGSTYYSDDESVYHDAKRLKLRLNGSNYIEAVVATVKEKLRLIPFGEPVPLTEASKEEEKKEVEEE